MTESKDVSALVRGRPEQAVPSGWRLVPDTLTFGMSVALEEAIIRHDKDTHRVWREVLDFAPAAPTAGGGDAR